MLPVSLCNQVVGVTGWSVLPGSLNYPVVGITGWSVLPAGRYYYTEFVGLLTQLVELQALFTLCCNSILVTSCYYSLAIEACTEHIYHCFQSTQTPTC